MRFFFCTHVRLYDLPTRRPTLWGRPPRWQLHSEHSKATMGAYGRVHFVLLCTIFILKLASYDNIIMASTISASGKLVFGGFHYREREGIIVMCIPDISIYIHSGFKLNKQASR